MTKKATYEDYVRVHVRWHRKLAQAFGACLDSSEYMHIRNALIVLTKIVKVRAYGDDFRRLQQPPLCRPPRWRLLSVFTSQQPTHPGRVGSRSARQTACGPDGGFCV